VYTSHMPFNHLAKPSQSADIVALFILVLVYSKKKFNGDFIVTVFVACMI